MRCSNVHYFTKPQTMKWQQAKRKIAIYLSYSKLLLEFELVHLYILSSLNRVSSLYTIAIRRNCKLGTQPEAWSSSTALRWHLKVVLSTRQPRIHYWALTYTNAGITAQQFSELQTQWLVTHDSVLLLPCFTNGFK